MARKHKNEVLVGGFIFLALGLFVLLIFLKGTLGQLFSPVSEVGVVFEDIRGLKDGDPVFFLGSKVGRVTEVEFTRCRWGERLPTLFPGETHEIARVLITLQVERRVKSLLRSKSPVEIDKNLTGNISVLLREGSGDPLPSAPAVLRGTSGADLNAIAEQIEATLKKAHPAVEDFASLARRLNSSGEIERAVTDVSQLARDLRETLSAVRKSLDETLSDVRQVLGENRKDLRTTVQNLAEGSDLARKVLQKIEPAAGDIGGALAQVEKAAGAVSAAIAGNRHGLDEIIEKGREALANAATITADIRRRPWRLLYKPSRDEVSTLDIYDAAWAYNLGASELERSLHGLASRLASDPAGSGDPQALRSAYLAVEESLKRHKEAEEAFFARLKGR